MRYMVKDSAAEAPVTVLNRADNVDSRRAGLTIWLRWKGDRESLRRAVGPLAVLDQHSLTEVLRLEARSEEWRCHLEFRGRGPDRDHQTLSLLRRLSAIAPWRRVERDVPEAEAQEGRADRRWEGFERTARA